MWSHVDVMGRQIHQPCGRPRRSPDACIIKLDGTWIAADAEQFQGDGQLCEGCSIPCGGTGCFGGGGALGGIHLLAEVLAIRVDLNGGPDFPASWAEARRCETRTEELLVTAVVTADSGNREHRRCMRKECRDEHPASHPLNLNRTFL